MFWNKCEYCGSKEGVEKVCTWMGVCGNKEYTFLCEKCRLLKDNMWRLTELKKGAIQKKYEKFKDLLFKFELNGKKESVKKVRDFLLKKVLELRKKDMGVIMARERMLMEEIENE